MPSLRSDWSALLLVLLVVLQRCGGQGAAEVRKPIYQRLRRLDNQFRQFQDLTLGRLESLSKMSNASKSLEVKVQTLTEQHHSLRLELTQLQNTTAQELGGLKDWSRKLQRRNRRMERRMTSVGKHLRHRQSRRQKHKESLSNLTLELHSQEGRLSSLEAQQEELLVMLKSLRDSLREQKLQMVRLEERLEELHQGNGVPSQGSKSDGDPFTTNLTPQDPTPEQRMQTAEVLSPKQSTRIQDEQTQTQIPPQASAQRQPSSQPKHTDDRRPPQHHPTQPPSQPQEDRQGLEERGQERLWAAPPQQGVEEERVQGEVESRSGKEVWRRRLDEPAERERGEEDEPQIQNLLPFRHKIPLEHVPRKQAAICNVEAMLLFPAASSENYVTFSRSFPALPEVSVCLWLLVDVGYVGTLLSYATDDSDNKLVLYGRSSASSTTPTRPTLDFVVGDPAYRELSVGSVLDGHWHHLCVLWSSIEGRFWHYTDRRLTSTGSRFRKGYEVPGGGSVVLGAEQDSSEGGFDSVEGFVGRLAGFMVWDRVLSPGEVTTVATGKGVPRGVVLGMEDVTGVHGGVEQVKCQCLEHCS